MNSQNSVFVREGHHRSSLRSKLSCMLLAFAMPVATLFAHGPGDGPGFTPNDTAKVLLPAPQSSASAVTDGQWVTLPYTMPINPIHCALMHNGKVLVVAGSENELQKHQAGQYSAAVWDTQAGTVDVQSLLWDVSVMAWPLCLTAGSWSSAEAVNSLRPTARHEQPCLIPRPQSLPRSKAWPMAVGTRA